ncbi:hypothetical protein LTR95_012742, partial [Oleoguttula sp. CCFEE 5521]
MLPAASLNRHYLVPASTNNVFTGRRSQLQAVHKVLSATVSHTQRTQRRLVVEGGPGSGKTELALKGVFWVDASSRSNAKQSYAKIAYEGGVDPSENAAKHWLSGRVYPWLLIVDNADGEDIELNDLLPPRSFGCVLVTTRNPKLNADGDESLILGPMDDKEGSELLLRAATTPRPWKANAVDLAVSICKHLHYLPLALIQAGRAIAREVFGCNLSNYIHFFDTHASGIRRDRSRSRSHGISNDEEISAFGSSEILYQSLVGGAAQDSRYQHALELLEMFSYMHFNDIRLDVLVHSAIGPLQEARTMSDRQSKEDQLVRHLNLPLPRPTWGAWATELLRSASRSKLLVTPLIIPALLKNRLNLVDDEELREVISTGLRQALRILVSRGLVTRLSYELVRGDKGTHDRYSMHPLVHRWIKERPQRLGEDALYCQMATTVLCRAIRLVGGDEESTKAMRRDLKPHIDHVTSCAAVIEQQVNENRGRHRTGWRNMVFSLFTGDLHPTFGPMQAEECGRFGKVYLETGSYADAEVMFRKVLTYIISRLGQDHAVANLVKLGLSEALWHQTKYNEASTVLQSVYESRRKMLGADHPQTLDIAYRHATSVLSQGFITSARLLQEETYDRLCRVHGPDSEKAMMSKLELARAQWYYQNHDEAARLGEEVLEELERRSTEDSTFEEQRLVCTENLAMSYMFLGPSKATKAVRMTRATVQRRIELQGEEGPMTLLSKAKLGQALGVNKEYEEAEV